MTRPRSLPRWAVPVFAPLGLGLLLAVGSGASMAAADDPQYDNDTVTISVTISELDLCERALPGCDHGGVLGMTGVEAATPLGLGILFLALGSGTYALASRRRRNPAEG